MPREILLGHFYSCVTSLDGPQRKGPDDILNAVGVEAPFAVPADCGSRPGLLLLSQRLKETARQQFYQMIYVFCHVGLNALRTHCYEQIVARDEGD
jgi:hypothetical protein